MLRKSNIKWNIVVISWSPQQDDTTSVTRLIRTIDCDSTTVKSRVELKEQERGDHGLLFVLFVVLLNIHRRYGSNGDGRGSSEDRIRSSLFKASSIEVISLVDGPLFMFDGIACITSSDQPKHISD